MELDIIFIIVGTAIIIALGINVDRSFGERLERMGALPKRKKPK